MKNKTNPVEQIEADLPTEPIVEAAPVVPMDDAQARALIRLLAHHARQIDNHELSHAKVLPLTEPGNDNPNITVQTARNQVANHERDIASNAKHASDLYKQLVAGGVTNIETKMDRYGGINKPVPAHIMARIREG